MTDSPPRRAYSMADVSGKPVTLRRALARGSIFVGEEAQDLLARAALPKGDALQMAEIAGIQGAKLTPMLLPLCHPISLSRVTIHTHTNEKAQDVTVYALAEISERTGVEMEALTAVSVALLTIWDLCKPINAALEITDTRLLYKSGGKDGEWINPGGLSPAEQELLSND